MISMKTPRPLTTLELALLGLLHTESRSGYELRKVFDTTPMAHCSSSPGAIYPALKRLEDRGLLASRTERLGTMRPRRVYSLTASGNRALLDWASRPVTREDLVWREDELILRFAFMGQLANRDVVLGFLEEIATGVDSLVRELADHHTKMLDEPLPGNVLPTGRFALLYGIGSYKNLARWARKTINEL